MVKWIGPSGLSLAKVGLACPCGFHPLDQLGQLAGANWNPGGFAGATERRTVRCRAVRLNRRQLRQCNFFVKLLIETNESGVLLHLS